MQSINIPRVVIAGTNSGVGKTTIVTGLLAYLCSHGLKVQAYKVGPDYIDPGYHQLATGKVTHNLDTWLLSETEILPVFLQSAKGNDLAVIEGVMGLYDGGRNGISSTAAIAKLLEAPVILAMNVGAMGESAAAMALGYKLYDKDVNIAGVIINNLGSSSHEKMIRDALQKIDIPVLGCMYRNREIALPERHLGLTSSLEYDAQNALEAMKKEIEQSVAIDRVVATACTAPPLKTVMREHAEKMQKVRIGVAQDKAFSFYYSASLDVLKAFGAELIPFSPLADPQIPEVDGLLFGGGFPEMFLEQLSANKSMMQSIQTAHRQGMPIYAECGGFMYLCWEIIGFSENGYRMVGLIPAVCRMEKKLQMLGYVEAKAYKENLLCEVGDTLRGHEFHFSKMTYDHEQDFAYAFQFKTMNSAKKYPGGFTEENLLASYLHVHFAGNQKAARRLIDKCLEFNKTRIGVK